MLLILLVSICRSHGTRCGAKSCLVPYLIVHIPNHCHSSLVLYATAFSCFLRKQAFCNFAFVYSCISLARDIDTPLKVMTCFVLLQIRLLLKCESYCFCWEFMLCLNGKKNHLVTLPHIYVRNVCRIGPLASKIKKGRPCYLVRVYT